MNDKLQKTYSRVLWGLTIAILAIIALQGISGNWVTIFLVFPGGTELSIAFKQAMGRLAQYHIVMGFAVGALSILIVVFAFLHNSHILVRLAAIAGLLLLGSAVMGWVLFVNSMLQDNWPLGQMMDSFIGVFAAYLLQVVFMGWKRLAA
jgi:hypothetical protein